jgi:hypothetical protein
MSPGRSVFAVSDVHQVQQHRFALPSTSCSQLTSILSAIPQELRESAHAKRASAGNIKIRRRCSLCVLNYLAFFRPAADQTDSALPWVASRGHSYSFLWADSIVKKYKLSSLLWESLKNVPEAHLQRSFEVFGSEKRNALTPRIRKFNFRRTTSSKLS